MLQENNVHAVAFRGDSGALALATLNGPMRVVNPTSGEDLPIELKDTRGKVVRVVFLEDDGTPYGCVLLLCLRRLLPEIRLNLLLLSGERTHPRTHPNDQISDRLST